MNPLRYAVLFLAGFAFLFSFAAPVRAQDDAPVETFGLSLDDWRLLGQANAASGNFETLQFEYDFIFDFGDLGSGRLFGSGALGGPLDDLNEETGLPPTMSVDLSGRVDSEGQRFPVDFEIRILDEMMFMRIAGMGVDNQWFGLRIADVLAFQEQTNPSGQLSDEEQAELAQQLNDLFERSAVDVSEIVQIERSPDQASSAHFVTTIDIGPILLDREIRRELVRVFERAANGTLNSTQLDFALIALADLELTFEQFINLETGFVERATFQFYTGILEFEGTLEVELAAYDQPVDVSEPDDWQDLTDLLGTVQM